MQSQSVFKWQDGLMKPRSVQIRKFGRSMSNQKTYIVLISTAFCKGITFCHSLQQKKVVWRCFRVWRC